MSFGPFLAFLECITSKKTPQNGMDLRKKPISRFFVKNTGFLAFLVPYLQEKFIKMKKIFSEFFSKVKGQESVKSQPYHYSVFFSSHDFENFKSRLEYSKISDRDSNSENLRSRLGFKKIQVAKTFQ